MTWILYNKRHGLYLFRDHRLLINGYATTSIHRTTLYDSWFQAWIVLMKYYLRAWDLGYHATRFEVTREDDIIVRDVMQA
jgi:hypothetical protein